MQLRFLREALNLTQNDLDRRAKLSIGTTRDIEMGRNQNPSIAVCKALVDALRASGAEGADIEQIFAATTKAS